VSCGDRSRQSAAARAPSLRGWWLCCVKTVRIVAVARAHRVMRISTLSVYAPRITSISTRQHSARCSPSRHRAIARLRARLSLRCAAARAIFRAHRRNDRDPGGDARPQHICSRRALALQQGRFARRRLVTAATLRLLAQTAGGRSAFRSARWRLAFSVQLTLPTTPQARGWRRLRLLSPTTAITPAVVADGSATVKSGARHHHLDGRLGGGVLSGVSVNGCVRRIRRTAVVDSAGHRISLDVGTLYIALRGPLSAAVSIVFARHCLLVPHCG